MHDRAGAVEIIVRVLESLSCSFNSFNTSTLILLPLSCETLYFSYSSRLHREVRNGKGAESDLLFRSLHLLVLILKGLVDNDRALIVTGSPVQCHGFNHFKDRAASWALGPRDC